MLQAPPVDRPPAARSFTQCLRRCEPCGIGFSNGSTPTLIWREPERNVPPEVHEGLHATLANALNARKRPEKLVEFGFSTSEDAVTWTVFTALRKAHLLDAS